VVSPTYRGSNTSQGGRVGKDDIDSPLLGFEILLCPFASLRSSAQNDILLRLSSFSIRIIIFIPCGTAGKQHV